MLIAERRAEGEHIAMLWGESCANNIVGRSHALHDLSTEVGMGLIRRKADAIPLLHSKPVQKVTSKNTNISRILLMKTESENIFMGDDVMVPSTVVVITTTTS